MGLVCVVGSRCTRALGAKTLGGNGAALVALLVEQEQESRTFDRSLRQRLEALERANDVRFRRAALKRDLRAGRVQLVDLLMDPPWWMESAQLIDFLVAVPKVGRVKANKVVQVCRVSPRKTFGGLSVRQRGELVDALRGVRRVPGGLPPALLAGAAS